MIPQLPDEITLWIGILIQFIPVLILFFVGWLVADNEADKKIQKETGVKDAEVLSWKVTLSYMVLGAVFAMVSMGTLLKDFATNFWIAMAIAGGMGLVFRPILPELQEIISAKLKAVLQAIFK